MWPDKAGSRASSPPGRLNRSEAHPWRIGVPIEASALPGRVQSPGGAGNVRQQSDSDPEPCRSTRVDHAVGCSGAPAKTGGHPLRRKCPYQVLLTGGYSQHFPGRRWRGTTGHPPGLAAISTPPLSTRRSCGRPAASMRRTTEPPRNRHVCRRRCPAAAAAAARAYLSASGLPGTVRVTGPQQIRVSVTVRRRAVFLALIGVSSLQATATAAADLVQGIESPGQ